jgi:hypothetical protein
MDELASWRACSPRLLAAAACAAAALLAGCQTTPPAGSVVTAQVLDVPRTRAGLKPLYADLHAAVLAGVTREDAARGRLVLGECAEPDGAAQGGLRFPLVTVVLPPGVQAQPGTLVDVGDVLSAAGASPRFHGRFRALGPPLTAETAVQSPFGDRLHARCDAAGRGMRVQVRRAIHASEVDFARPEVRRHQGVRDEEFARGLVAIAACQLKVVDGADWYRPAWIARVPAGLELRPGQVVRLRTGAAESSTDTEPLAEVIGLDARNAPPGGNAVVRCH